MKRSTLSILGILGSAMLGGCVHSSDVEISNPLVARKVEQNRITKPHAYAESQHGLPPGSLTDEARMTSMNDAQVCFAITMHELVPVDSDRIKASLHSSKAPTLDRPQVTVPPETTKTYSGLVPLRRQTGQETVCASKDRYDVCQRWETRPTYVTDMVPGPVNVHEIKGGLCFATNGKLTGETDYVKLDVKVPTIGTPTLAANGNPFAMGFSAFGPQEARNEFSWGLVGTAKK